MGVGNQLNSSDVKVCDKNASGVARRPDKSVSQFSKVILQLTNTSEKDQLSPSSPGFAWLGHGANAEPNDRFRFCEKD